MKLYIAAHSQEEARAVAELCQESGYQITSRWLYQDFNRTSEYTENERAAIAAADVADITDSDAIVLLPSSRRIPGGKFVEAGVAIGQGKPVFILGHRENMLLWHPLTRCFNSAEDFLRHNPPN